MNHMRWLRSLFVVFFLHFIVGRCAEEDDEDVADELDKLDNELDELGELDEDELDDLGESQAEEEGPPTPEQIISRMDKNDDEKLSIEELMPPEEGVPEEEQGSVREKFQLADKDGDNLLNLAELTDFMKMFGEHEER